MNSEQRAVATADIHLLKAEQSEVIPQEWGALTWFANRELGNTNEVTMGQCLLYPGQSNPRHYHPNCSEILVVFQGRIEHTMENGQVAEMNPGDTVTIAPNIWHQAKNIGDTNAVLIIVFTSADRQTVGE